MIRQRENGTIELEQNGRSVQRVKPQLRELAVKLRVIRQNNNGNDLNTRQLGLQVIRVMAAL